MIYVFNEACSNIASIYLKVGDEFKSETRFCTMSRVNLSHLSCIFLKMEPLSTEFNMVAWFSIGALVFLKIQWGEEGMK